MIIKASLEIFKILITLLKCKFETKGHVIIFHFRIFNLCSRVQANQANRGNQENQANQANQANRGNQESLLILNNKSLYYTMNIN